MKAPHRIAATWQLRSRTLELGRRTLVMGIVNVTPDSFSDGGFFLAPEAAVAHALQLLDEGADLLDLGAESTRPGSRAGSRVSGAVGSSSPAAHPSGNGSSEVPAVSAEEEQARLLPVLEGILKARPDAVVSVDTYKAATARAALAAGAEIINDVSGFLWDAEMAAVCAEARGGQRGPTQHGPGVILMHTRGRPEEWAAQPPLAPDELLATVRNGLAKSLALAAAAGIPPQAVVLDPGYGFGKRGYGFGKRGYADGCVGEDENFVLLARQAELLVLGRPLLAGLSRKSFLGRALAQLYIDQKSAGRSESALAVPAQTSVQAPILARETASIAALVAAILHGASIVRVHAVRPAREAALIADAVLAAE